jgi:transposase InsO family protein
MEVSRSAYFEWRSHPESQRRLSDQALATDIERIHIQSHETYGSPRIHQELQTQGQRVGRKRVARLMQELGIHADRPRRFVVTTDSDHSLPVAENLLQQDFTAQEPNTRWVTDITYVPTEEGTLYLSAVEDLFSRKIIGWSMDGHMEASLVLRALDMAVTNRELRPGLIHHSDRGSQYASHEYTDRLKELGIDISMSRRGNCYDNACVESFWARLKVEWLHPRCFRTKEEAKKAIFEYIEVFYNRVRRHSALGYLSPNDYEAAYWRRQSEAS